MERVHAREVAVIKFTCLFVADFMYCYSSALVIEGVDES